MYFFYQSDEEQDPEYLKTHIRKGKDMYLMETVKLLNEGCTNAKKYNSYTRRGEQLYKWCIDDIDYDFDVCRAYCLYTDPWDVCSGEYRLCSSCNTIIKTRIQEPFTKTKSELIYDSILLQEQMKNILERLAKLEAMRL